MDNQKKKRLAALKAEIQYGAKPPVKQKEKLDLWDELNLNRPVIADKPRAAVAPIATAPIPEPAVISPKPEPIKPQETIAPVIDRIKIYHWPDGYCLANGSVIDPQGPEYASGERFKIFHPPNQWLARTEDGTAREYEITVELDAWDSAQLKRVNRVLSHNPKPSVVNPYTGFRE
jgi:hypothetical protein